MNFPLRGDLNFLRKLEKGTPLYLCEAEWNPENGHTELKVETIYFDHYDERSVGSLDKDDTPIFAALSDKKGGIGAGVHDIRFGFYETPKQAIESLVTYYDEGLQAAKRALDKETKRLEKSVKKFIKENVK